MYIHIVDKYHICTVKHEQQIKFQLSTALRQAQATVHRALVPDDTLVHTNNQAAEQHMRDKRQDIAIRDSLKRLEFYTRNYFL